LQKDIFKYSTDKAGGLISSPYTFNLLLSVLYD